MRLNIFYKFSRGQFFKFIIAIIISELAGVIGSIFNISSVPGWYAALQKPAFNPPAWVFAPVWTILYALMGVAAFFLWRNGWEKRRVKIALGVFGVQLFLNAAWSIIFFGLHSPGWAFVEIVFLWLATFSTIVVFFKISRPAAYLLVPYILWVSFAAYLNFSIWQLNRYNIYNFQSKSVGARVLPPCGSASAPCNFFSSLVYPIAGGNTRITKKPFGIFVSPQSSPISPERFTGYHTGVDFEILPNEQNIDVQIYASCSGEVLMKKWASGYGGVLIEECELNGEGVTIIYGHLRLTSIIPPQGAKIEAGQKIGVLGREYSEETDGERKHLHFAVYKGVAVNILGYVKNSAELNNWLNPEKLLIYK